MRTTINQVDRRGDAHSIERLESILIDARRILADAGALLELEIEALEKSSPLDDTATKHLENLKSVLTECRKSTTQVIDLEAKLCMHALSFGPPLDLEAARDEILSRFATFDS
ncbi:MAG: hypothetical protein AAF674_05080 [Pseudomonadota bacterium]